MGIEMSGEELRKARETGRMPHKHAALIKAWADGALIQIKVEDGTWEDRTTPMWLPHFQYRIKPKTIKYRNFLWKPFSAEYGHRVVCVCTEQDHLRENREKWAGFVKWLGDWEEVEE